MDIAAGTAYQLRPVVRREIHLRLFLQDHVTRTWYLMLWLALLSLAALAYVVRQLNATPVSTLVLLVIWLAGLVSVIVGEVRHQHTAISRWLKRNIYTSITSTLLTLLLILFAAAALRAIWGYAVVRATFDPALTAPEFRTAGSGATWGVISGAWKLLMTGTLPVVHLPRVYLALWFVIIMSIVSPFVYGTQRGERARLFRRILTIIWLLSPPILYIFLVGLPDSGPLISIQKLVGGEVLVLTLYAVLYWQRVVTFSWGSFAVWVLTWPALYGAWRLVARTGAFSEINVDNWGGLLFTMIVSVFAIVVSFPLGVALALGRRSQVYGIPAWITYPAAIAVTIWGLATSTPGLLDLARNNVERILAFWPLLILLVAFGFQHFFNGNVVAAASTVYIEVIRGVPLITVLFMTIIMVPLFFPPGAQVKNAWAVMVGFTLFTAAYLAENVRGGLQAIVRGQYEAADALGLNTLQKMRFIVLPQALRAVIPAIVGLFIGVFKDSSLVAVVGLFDLLGIINPIVSNPQWLGLRRELYLFAAVIYFFGSYAMSAYSYGLERRLGVGER